MWLRFRNYAIAILLFQLLVFLISVVLLVNVGWLGERVANALTAPPANQPPETLIAWMDGEDVASVAERVKELYRDDTTKHVVLVYDLTDAELEQANELMTANGVTPTHVIDSSSVSNTSVELQAFFNANQIASATVVSEWYHGRRGVCTVQAAANSSIPIGFAGTESIFAENNWWLSEVGMVGVATEFAKTAYYTLIRQIPFSGCWSGDFPFVLVTFYAGVAFILSGLLVAALRSYTVRRQMLDIANERSLHKIPTPRGGGVLISTLTLVMLVSVAVRFSDLPFGLLAVYIAMAVLLTCMSLYDDWIRAVTTKVRLIVHLLSAMLVVAASFTFRPVEIAVQIPSVTMLFISGIIAAGILVVWITGFTNMFNFMDGVDGIAGLHAVLVGTGWSILFFLEGESTLALISLLIVATSAGFLVHNTSPARIFMGDSGSVFLGFTLASLPVLGFVGIGDPHLFVVGGMFVLPFVVDATYTIIKRWRNGENILEAHRKHLYQRLALRGHSHGGVTGLYGFMTVICVTCGIFYYTGNSAARSVAMGVVAIMITTYMLVTEYILAAKPFLYKASNPVSITDSSQD